MSFHRRILCPSDSSGQRSGRATEEWVAKEIISKSPASLIWGEAIRRELGSSKLEFIGAGLQRGNDKADVCAKIIHAIAPESPPVASVSGISVKSFARSKVTIELGAHLYRGSLASAQGRGTLPEMARSAGLFDLLTGWVSGTHPILSWSDDARSDACALMQPTWDSLTEAALWSSGDEALPCQSMVIVERQIQGLHSVVLSSLVLGRSSFSRLIRSLRQPLRIDPRNGGCLTDGIFLLQEASGDFQWKFDVVKLFDAGRADLPSNLALPDS